MRIGKLHDPRQKKAKVFIHMTQRKKYAPGDTTYRVANIAAHIKDRTKPLIARVPGSKSVTNRALLLATLAEGTSTLRGVLFSDDSRHFLKCVQELGFETTVDEEHTTITVRGLGGAVAKKQASLYVGSAGTAARFLTAYLGISDGTYHMDASAQMRRRPMAPLLQSLQELGCEIDCEEEPGHFPFTLSGHGLQKDSITINIDSSSQFMSALLISACLSERDFTVVMEGSHGTAYIDMTVRMMQQFGVRAVPQYYCGGNAQNHDCAGCENSTRPYAYMVPAGQIYNALDYQIEPDVSAACYFYAMSPLLGIPVLVEHVRSASLQGDIAFIRILEQMGCRADETEEGILVTPPADGTFHGVTVDMSACSDQAITLAAIAPFADSPTTITNIGHIRLQESDRIAAITNELSRLGIRVTSDERSVTIYPGTPKPGLVETYDDHRMAMGFSLIGLRSDGIVINDPGCCRKTFEAYFETLDSLVDGLTR